MSVITQNSKVAQIVLTALKFFTSDKYEPDYENDLFIGNANK